MKNKYINYLIKYRSNKEAEIMLADIFTWVSKLNLEISEVLWKQFLSESDMDVLEWLQKRDPLPERYQAFSLAIDRAFAHNIPIPILQ